MLKNISRLEAKVGEKVFHFLSDMDANTHEVKQALYQYLGFVNQVEEDAKKKEQESKKVESIPQEAITVEG